MKIISLLICFMFLTTLAFADIATTQGEDKAIQALKSIYRTLEGAKESTTREYNALKTYIVDHPTQFSASDKTKLNNLQTLLNTINTDILNFMTQVKTDFSGIDE